MREQLLSFRRPPQPVDLSEFGITGDYFVRRLSAGEMLDWVQLGLDKQVRKATLFLIAHSVCDAAGQRVFTDTDDLSQMDVGLADKLAKAANYSADISKDIDDLKKS